MLSNHHNSILIFNISVSIFGIFIVLLLACNPPIIHENLFWRKSLVGLLFSIICILGVFTVLFPKPCSQMFHSRRENTNFHSYRINAASHHPDCGEFSAHVVHISNHTFCAACTGLLLGALAVLFGTTFYFFGGSHIEGVSFPEVLVGVIGVVLGFFQFKFRRFVRLVLNAFFVLGAFFILVGIDELTENLFIDLFLVVFIVFWILTRIQISQWDHWRICRSCESSCELRGTKKKMG